MAKDKFSNEELSQIGDLKAKIAIAMTSFQDGHLPEEQDGLLSLQHLAATPSKKVKKSLSKFFKGSLKIKFKKGGHVSIRRDPDGNDN